MLLDYYIDVKVIIQLNNQPPVYVEQKRWTLYSVLITIYVIVLCFCH